jgi:pimeloyl-ACP methyl ester carboxylesterase
MLEMLPHGSYHEIAGAGHLMSVDQPVAYAKAIGEALRRTQ